MSFCRIGRIAAATLLVLFLLALSAIYPLQTANFGPQSVSADSNPKSEIRNPKSEIPKLPPEALAKIEPMLLEQITEKGQATFIIYLQEQADLSPAMQIQDLTERRLAVVDTLRRTAERSQRNLLNFLRKQEQAGYASDITPLWIFNGVGVTGDAGTLAAIAQRDDVVKIRANHVRYLPKPMEDEPYTAQPQTLLWNIERIRANLVWSELGITGRGVVVANLDTGVDWQHNALREKYRGRDGDHNYNWFDFTETYPQSPDDGHNHGTHTMGTMVGDGVDETGQRLQIGVAPGAEWIAVKIFTDSGESNDLWIHQAFQWVLAPTDLNGNNPDPTKAPDVVNNSWGSSNGADVTFRPDIQALRAAGIVPVFSAGNSGERGVGTVGAPASNPESIAVGATGPDPIIASFSSQGPSFWGEIKPEFSAPGQSIRSSVADNNYAVFQGTSMAAPHVAGTIALMLEAARQAQLAMAHSSTPDQAGLQQADSMPSIDDLEQFLAMTAVDIGEPGPDNLSGAGRIDAYRATVWAMTAGKLYGFVRDSETGAPIAGATVTGVSTTNPEDRFTTRSARNGEYSVAVPKGRYTVEVTAFGYEPQTVQNVDVATGYLSLQDIKLKRLPTGTVAGQVRTADGTPVLATVEVVGTPITAQTDGKGTYSLELPAGTHTLRVAAAGYRTETAQVTVTVGERTVHTFVLKVAPATLFVDADQWFGDNVSLYYTYVLEKAGIPFDSRPITSTDNVPTVTELAAYDVVIWAHPWTSPGFIDQQREDTATVDALTGYLAQGGRLLLTGQDIGWLDGGGNPSGGGALSYFQNVLHARYVANSASRDSTITGASEDIMAGIELQFDGPFAYKRSDRGFSPDAIEPADEAAQTIFTYNDENGAGIKAQADSYRLVYLSFAADTTSPREQLVETFARAYDWLSRPVLTKSVDQSAAVPGARLTYTITLENAIGSPLDDVRLVDRLPKAIEFVFDTVTGGAVYNRDRRSIEWRGSIPPRDSVTITFQADLREDLPGNTVVTNIAEATAGSIQLEAKAATRVLGPNLSGSIKTVDKPRVSAGEMMTYTIRLLNSSSVVTATGVSLVDPIPDGTQYVADSVTGGAIYDPESQEIRWSGDVPAAAPEGAPYTWIDSDTEGGPTFAWDSRAEEQGQRVAGMGDDTISAELPIGFEFPFFDETFDSFRISSNGFLSFTSTETPFRNIALPSPDAPGNLVAPFWDDLTLTSQGTVYVWSNEVDTLVVSWVDVLRFGGSEPYTFQAILHADGTILFQYRQLGSQVDSATVGIQNRDGTAGLTIAYNEPYVHEGLAILLIPPQPPVAPPVITFAVRVNEDIAAGSTITNTAWVDDGRGQITVLTAASQANTPDLTTSQKTAPETILPGDILTYTLILSNTGHLSATVTVSDPIPAGTQYLTDSATGGAVYDDATNAIGWRGIVPAGQSHTLSFAVVPGLEVEAGTTITNTATIDDGITEPFDLVATTRIIKPDLSRSIKFVDRSEARSGDVLNYTIRIENSSPVTIPEVSIVDHLPEGLSYVPDSLSDNAVFDPTENAIRWTGALPARGEGYAWDDSDATGGPLFAWDDRPETVGVRVRDEWTLGDDTNVGPFPIGFDFPFFDGNFTEFYLSTNGFLSFNLITDRFFSNKQLPDPAAPGNLIAVFWDDLDLRQQGEIYYWTNNVDTLVVSWVDVLHLARGGPYTFQAILKSDGTLLFQYKDMDPSRVEEATIGIQNADGSEGLTVAHDEPYVHNELAVRIAPPTGKERIQFQAQVNEDVPLETVIVNTVVIKDNFGNQIERQAKTEVNTLDLSGAMMRASTQQVAPGGQLAYQFTIPNAGTADATQTLVVNPLPESLAYVEGSATGGAFYEPALREIRWQGTVPAGEMVTFAYSATVRHPTPASGLPRLRDGDIISNTATINDGLHPPITRTVDVQVVAPDLSRSQKQAPAVIGRGATLTYLVRIINSGHAPADVTFTDPLPNGVTYVEGSGQTSFGGPVSFEADRRTVMWTGTLPARGIAELRFSVLVTGDIDSLTNTATVDDGLGTTIELKAITQVVPYRFLLPLILR